MISVPPRSNFQQEYSSQLKNHYDAAPVSHSWAGRGYYSWLAHYYNLIIPKDATVLEIGCGSGELLARLHTKNIIGIDLSEIQIEAARKRIPYGTFIQGAGETLTLNQKVDFIIVSDAINYVMDVQDLLLHLQSIAGPETRLVVNFHSALWKPILSFATFLGLRPKQPQCSWLATPDVKNLMALSNWEVIKTDGRLLIPFPLLGLDKIVNRWISPLMQWLCLGVFCVARVKTQSPLKQSKTLPKVSVVIPARNEAGNIEAAVLRTPMMGSSTELIFVEGGSKDNTWSEIERIKREYPDRDIKILKQTGKGKGDAVRAGYAVATGDILMILDADLTMPPEDLVKFYQVLESGKAEFANGVRLVYPMEKEAMRFLNLCANKFFSITFTWLLGQSVKDTLCGTKVLWKKDYERIAANRSFFGDFDPFGDFDLLFGAAKANLQIMDIPIRYRDRTYGSTNINRWSHGLLLLRMVIFAARKLKFV
jgi:ubiquinone/menaquinone biosynthesis C-methylase UbiE